MPKRTMMKCPEGKVPRGRMIRLYPTLAEKQHLRLVQDEARHAWNLLVGKYNRAVKAQFESAEKNGIIGPKPDKPKSDAGQAAWHAYYKTLSERRRLAREHAPELRMPIPKTDAEQYKWLMKEWDEITGKPRRMTANMYQAVIADFAQAMLPKKGNVRWRPPRFRRDTDDMPIRTGTGYCIKPSGDRKRNALVQLPGLGWMSGIAHRDLELMKQGSMVQGIAFREQTDGWYAAVRVYVDKPEPVRPSIDRAVGVDINMDFLAVTSDGDRWENPRSKVFDIELPKEGPAPKIKRAPRDRILSDKIDNKWRESPERALTRRARHVGCLIDQIVHHLEQYRTVVLEDSRPSLDSLPKKQRADPYVMAPGRLWTALKNRLGDRTVFVQTEFSSQECSSCGHRDKAAWSRKTGAGEHAELCKCPQCGYECDRDVNAARNLAHRYEESLGR